MASDPKVPNLSPPKNDLESLHEFCQQVYDLIQARNLGGTVHKNEMPGGMTVRPGRDADADLITVDVTGTPKISWNESADKLAASKPFTAASLSKIGWKLDKNGTDQSNVGTGLTLITWDDANSQAFTSGVSFSDANDQITIETAGPYLIMAQLGFFNVADGDRLQMQIAAPNGADTHSTQWQAGGTNRNYVFGAIIKDLDANDVVEINGRDITTGTADIEGDPNSTWFCGVHLGGS